MQARDLIINKDDLVKLLTGCDAKKHFSQDLKLDEGGDSEIYEAAAQIAAVRISLIGFN